MKTRSEAIPSPFPAGSLSLPSPQPFPHCLTKAGQARNPTFTNAQVQHKGTKKPPQRFNFPIEKSRQFAIMYECTYVHPTIHPSASSPPTPENPR